MKLNPREETAGFPAGNVDKPGDTKPPLVEVDLIRRL